MRLPCIVVGFSGGVDSTVMALLLKKRSYNVHAVTFIFTDAYLSSDFQNYMAELVATLGVDHSYIDLRDTFQNTVLDYFKQGYMRGITPNPCVYCNNDLKWPELFKTAHHKGIQKVAMGHYARLVSFQNIKAIAKAPDSDKDQSFFLWKLSPNQLQNVEFPIGEMNKADVKQLATHKGFEIVANRKESTGPCFVNRDYRRTLTQLTPLDEMPSNGNFIDESGRVVGRHKGFPFYTIGQRHGLGIMSTRRLFVKELRPATNHVVVAEPDSLWCNEFLLVDCVIHYPEIVFNELIEVKIRYRNQLTFAKLTQQNDMILVKSTSAVWAVAPGQTAALYFNDVLVGGGFIHKASF